MQGHVDNVLRSIAVEYVNQTQEYDDTGRPVVNEVSRATYNANIQPLLPDELDFLNRGNIRYVDARKVYINNGDLSIIKGTGKFIFLDREWTVYSLDKREWNNYLKAIVYATDE